MKVVIAFDPDFGSRRYIDLADAFWLVDTAPNRLLAEEAWAANRTDPNSALFQPNPDSSPDHQAVTRFEDAELHHPDLTVMEFSGVSLTPRLERDFAECGLRITRREDGFIIAK